MFPADIRTLNSSSIISFLLNCKQKNISFDEMNKIINIDSLIGEAILSEKITPSEYITLFEKNDHQNKCILHIWQQHLTDIEFHDDHFESCTRYQFIKKEFIKINEFMENLMKSA
jgi:hypothetical protein